MEYCSLSIMDYQEAATSWTNLSIREQEDDAAVLSASFQHCLLEVVSPLSLTVSLGYLDLRALKFRHVCS